MKILFSYPWSLSSFMRRDLEMLREDHEVRAVGWKGLKTLPELRKGAKWANLGFSWFADRHAAWNVKLMKKQSKPSIVVVGGYDAANIPELEYGSFQDPSRKKHAIFCYQNATRLLTVDNNLKEKIITHTGLSGDNIFTVPNCFDTNFWTPGVRDTEPLIITVGTLGKTTIPIKGLDTLANAARKVTDMKFAVIGNDSDEHGVRFKQDAPPNMQFPGFMEPSELRGWYRRAHIYVQVSLSESFGCAMAEAMLCGCIPVGTEVGGIPTVMGDTGFYVPEKDPANLVKTITNALGSGNHEAPRTRIVENFPKARRLRELTLHIKAITQK